MFSTEEAKNKRSNINILKPTQFMCRCFHFHACVQGCANVKITAIARSIRQRLTDLENGAKIRSISIICPQSKADRNNKEAV